MTPRTLIPLAALSVLALALAAAATAAPRGFSAQASQRITAAGVGQVKLGRTHDQLRDRGLVGRLRPGCPLGGPGTRSARLRAPLRGSVFYTRSSPRRVQSISLTRGARARGVGFGSTIPQIRNAFRHVRVDRDTEEVFNITLVTVRREGRRRPRFQFAVDVDTDRTTLIGVPFIAFCE